ncbi:MAG: sugar phosphate isomerase/epimerase [Elusimicrobia bacterium]|nr:sugar phosphate isomerase/epimerase [Elusimicrobiota bacterium]
MSNFCFRKDYRQVLEWTLENGFDGIEIWADAPYFSVDAVSIKHLREYGRAGERMQYTVHSPIFDVNLCSVNTGIRNESIRQVRKIIEWSEYITIRHLIVHPGKIPSIIPDVLKEVEPRLRDTLGGLKEECSRCGIELLLENIGINTLDLDSDIDAFGSLVDDLSLGVCLDTGHANIRWGTETAVRRFGRMAKQIHASDNSGAGDEHRPVGEGSIRWESYRELMKSGDRVIVHEIQDPDPENATLRSRANLERMFGDCFT